MRIPGLFSIIRLAIVSLALAGCLLANPAAAQDVVSQDGLLADLQVSGDRALVRWRFLKPLTSIVREISGDLNGEPLGIPRISGYPAYGDVTRILVLIDPTGRDRTDSVNRQMAAAIQLGQIVPQHVQIAYGVYSTETTVLVPRDFDQLVTNLALVRAADERPDLPAALTSGIRMLSSLPAQRRALFMFTDGHSDVPIKSESSPNCADCAEAIANLALRSGVSVNFILANSSRSKELDAIRLISDRSGGQIVEEANTISFITQPLNLVDSGGSVVFPIPQHTIYFWQPEPKLTITFDMGARKLQLTSLTPQPRATAGQTLTYSWDAHRWYAISGTVFLLLLIGAVAALFVRLVRRRSHRAAVDNRRSVGPEDEARRQTIYALLQNIDDGKSIPVYAERVNLGRAGSNDIVIDDKAVSREHATLVRDHGGRFTIESRGANGTFVNHLQVEQAELADGDLITMGDTTLRFVRTKA